MQVSERQRRYWSANLRMTAALLAIWFVATFGLGWFARDLSFSFFGWPFSFWVAAQGAPLVYGLIIWYYYHYMKRLDRQYGFGEEEPQ
jgi:putative solute:sodium symporter small subunit